MSQAVATELREHRRLAPTILRADVEWDGKRQQGYLMNVSLGGTFLTVEDAPSPESPLVLHILFPWGLGECRLDARAVWVQTDELGRSIGVGVSFVGVS
ncbi:MAG: PilZ domain-containing protein, partial [Vicinamibacteria bacterium]